MTGSAVMTDPTWAVGGLALPDPAHRDVTVGDDPHQAVAVDDQERSDPVASQQLPGLLQRAPGRDGHRRASSGTLSPASLLTPFESVRPVAA